ncbi:NAD(P)/FAD-dependent oxidoreductase [Anaeroselena agilis]|uniref:NAD(P)/FAD-dependent oxidoreductase n=1 Tax=Anaeroselena agilis TaxID=3063788 RepID=A0ABU3P3D4_9FIRM|nr:NAD(P)/FAD-dependent oxidoreductase [Selenomonadales bacterium 4137-cl]
MAEKVFDIAVVGGGPAGLSAALTGRIRNKEVALFEHLDFSQKLQKAHLVDNYPGLPQITGKGLMQQMAAHCLAHEPTIIKEKVLNIYPGEVFTLLTPAATYEAKAVILTTGVVATVLFAGEKEFLGRGVSYCATCDAMFYKDKNVAVISYTAEGEHEATYLGELCRQVYYLPQYKGELPRFMENVRVVTDKPRAIKGDSQVEELATDQGALAVDGVFILRQSDPVENVLPGLELDGEVIRVGRDMATSIPGVFAAGDCTGKPWQIAKATGEGLVAVLSAIGYLESKARQAAP